MLNAVCHHSLPREAGLRLAGRPAMVPSQTTRDLAVFRALLNAMLAALGIVEAVFLFGFHVFHRCLVGNQRQPTAADMQPTAADVYDAGNEKREAVLEVKRWAAATIQGRQAYPDGLYKRWMTALDREAAVLIGQAALDGKLQEHLDGTRLIEGVPAVASYEKTRSWMRQNRTARPVVMEATFDHAPRTICAQSMRA
jgi:hypothetical protein